MLKLNGKRIKHPQDGENVDTFDPENVQAGENVGLGMSLACNISGCESGVTHV